MASEPPTPAQVRAALDRLGRSERLDVALHLALPRSSGLREVGLRDQVLTWRGQQVPAQRDFVQAAQALAQAGWAEGDEALNLSGPRWTWLKRLPRGSRVDLSGTDLLFDGPRVWVNAALPRRIDEQIAVALQQELTPPLLISCEGVPAVIEARSSGRWHVEPLTRPDVPRTDPAAAAAVLARQCRASAWEVSTDHVVLDIPGGRVHVPWHSEHAVHVATTPLAWWDTGTGEWTAIGVDDAGRVWLRHASGVRGWWDAGT